MQPPADLELVFQLRDPSKSVVSEPDLHRYKMCSIGCITCKGKRRKGFHRRMQDAATGCPSDGSAGADPGRRKWLCFQF